MTERTLSLILLVSALFVAALVCRNGALALMALPLLAYLGVGTLYAPSRSRTRLQAERSPVVRRVGEVAEVAVRVTVRNAGEGTWPLVISDPPYVAVRVTDGALRRWASLAPGETAELSYTFQSVRASLQWKSVRAVVSDPFGLFEIDYALPAAGEVLVQPLLRRFRPFPPRPARTLRSPGSILARAGGAGTDFWGVREYHPGDPLRRLDWRRTARRPHQLFTKELEKEEIADIGLILDARQVTNTPRYPVDLSPRYPVDLSPRDHETLFEHSLGAVASLAEMFLRGGNRVSLLVAGHVMTIVRAGYGKVQLNRILRCLARTRPDENQADVSLDHTPLCTFDSRALVVIVSPLSLTDWQIFPRLRARGSQGLLISPDPISFAQDASREDRVGLLATRIARIERRLQLRAIGHLGIRVIDWQVREPLGPLVRNALRAAGRHQ